MAKDALSPSLEVAFAHKYGGRSRKLSANDAGAEEALIGAQIDKIRSLDKIKLKIRWEAMFGKPAPKALTKDLLARMIAYRIQEQAFGGLDRATQKLLESYAHEGKAAHLQRHMKTGTVLIREYQGIRHTVTVSDGGFIYCEKKYPSLTKIAREITGTAWNGPRFFGLREHKQKRDVKSASSAAVNSSEPRRAKT